MNSILIGVDESERSEDAIAFGRRLAGVSTAPVVIGCAFPYNDMPTRASNVTYRNYLRSDAEKTAGAMRDRLDVERAYIRLIAEPSPAKGLDHIAHSEQAALVVVGSTHTGRLGRVAPGSTAERLLHGSPCAVAVVPDGYRNQDERALRRIGVAYHGTEESQAAVGAAVELARAFGATVQVIGVIAGEMYRVAPMMSAEGYREVREQVEQEVDHTLAAVADGLPPDVKGSSFRLDGDPAECLGAHSAELDLLVIGSRGYGPLRAVVAGGVSGRVMRTAQCPVIVVPRGADTPLGTLFDSSAAAAV